MYRDLKYFLSLKYGRASDVTAPFLVFGCSALAGSGFISIIDLACSVLRQSYF